MIDRILRAAEEWGRGQYGRNVRVTTYTEPCRDPSGTMTADVELQPDDGPKVAVHCLVTLEPDGTVSCFKQGQETS